MNLKRIESLEKIALSPVETIEGERDHLTGEEIQQYERTLGRFAEFARRKTFFRNAAQLLAGCNEFWDPRSVERRTVDKSINRIQRPLAIARIRTVIKAVQALAHGKISAADQEKMMETIQIRIKSIIAKTDTLDNISPFIPEQITRSEPEEDRLLEGTASEDFIVILPEKGVTETNS